MSDHVHPLTPEQRFCLEGCRSYGQYHAMRQGFEVGLCAFCDIDRTLNRVLWEDDYACCWAVPTTFLRKELKGHYIVVPKRHIRFPWERSTNEVLAMHRCVHFLSGMFELDGGIVATRFGDMRLNAGTVPHLHENIMVPNGTGEVRIPVTKDLADREANTARAAEFAARYESGEAP